MIVGSQVYNSPLLLRLSLLDFIHLKHFLSDELNGNVDLVEKNSLIPELRDAILAESVYV